MCRQELDVGAVRPWAMAKYLYNNGWHFNKKMCEYAVSLMRKKNPIGMNMKKIATETRRWVLSMMKKMMMK